MIKCPLNIVTNAVDITLQCTDSIVPLQLDECLFYLKIAR